MHALNWFCQEREGWDSLVSPPIHIPAKAALTAQTQPGRKWLWNSPQQAALNLGAAKYKEQASPFSALTRAEAVSQKLACSTEGLWRPAWVSFAPVIHLRD